MVSIADTRSPSRHVGRSMRTIFPPISNSRNQQFSENLSDSAVDFKLTELSSNTNSKSKSNSIDISAVAALLDIDISNGSDGSFSDLNSSFSSDISGELRRLSLLPQQSIFPSNQEIVPAHFIDDGEDDVDRMTLDQVEPVVRSCVEILESSSEYEKYKCNAVRKIRMLAKHRSDFRYLIGSLGAVEALVPCLKSIDPVIQENAATALLNLSLEEENRMVITSAGAIKPLIYALKTGTSTAKQNAACALLSLGMIEENRMSIGVLGAIPPLVGLLVHGTNRGKKDALTTLYKLCSVKQNKERAVRAGAVGPLVGLIGEHGSGIAEKAMVVMNCLAGIQEGRDAIVEEGGLQVLVEAMEDGPSKGKEFAVVTLLQMCSESVKNRGLLVREGAIPPLVALSQSGSARAKHKAETLLRYLREQRHDNTSSNIGR